MYDDYNDMDKCPWKDPEDLLDEVIHCLERKWNCHQADIRRAFSPDIKSAFIRLKASGNG